MWTAQLLGRLTVQGPLPAYPPRAVPLPSDSTRCGHVSQLLEATQEERTLAGASGVPRAWGALQVLLTSVEMSFVGKCALNP